MQTSGPQRYSITIPTCRYECAKLILTTKMCVRPTWQINEYDRRTFWSRVINMMWLIRVWLEVAYISRDDTSYLGVYRLVGFTTIQYGLSSAPKPRVTRAQIRIKTMRLGDGSNQDPGNAGHQQVDPPECSGVSAKCGFSRGAETSLKLVPPDFTALGRQFDMLCAVALAFLQCLV